MSKIKRSYGIFLCYFDHTQHCLKILAVRRRCTYSYYDFVTQRPRSETKILAMLNQMTVDEKTEIISGDFQRIYLRLYGLTFDQLSDAHQTKYRIMHEKWMRQYVNSDRMPMIKHLINLSQDSEDIWEIPKGHKNGSEGNINTAMRELSEETGVHPDKYTIISDKATTVSHESCGVQYICHYYPAVFNNPREAKNISLNYENPEQMLEIMGIKWITAAEAQFMGRIYNTVRNVVRSIKCIVPVSQLNVAPDTPEISAISRSDGSSDSPR